jgi:hypothetical protein
MMKPFSMSSFVGGFMLGAIVVAAWLLGGDFSSIASTVYTPHPSEQTVSTPKPKSSESGAVSVTDQSAGSNVSVESVTVPPPGVWVAVREMNGNDLGNVLGAVRVTGPRSNVTVPLLRATVPGSTYAIELYRDDGNDVFDLSADSVYVDFTTGEPVITYFTTAS